MGKYSWSFNCGLRRTLIGKRHHFVISWDLLSYDVSSTVMESQIRFYRDLKKVQNQGPFLGPQTMSKYLGPQKGSKMWPPYFRLSLY